MSGARPLYAVAGGLCVIGGFYLAGRSGAKTTATASLEDRFSAAGGGRDHTPGAASPLGQSEKIDGANGAQGRGSFKFNEEIKEQQVGHAVVTRTNPPPEQNKLQPKAPKS